MPSGTLTSSITICPVTLALRENFPSILGVVNPFIDLSKMKPLISPPCSSDLAQITKTSATGEFVILNEFYSNSENELILNKKNNEYHVFEPFKINSFVWESYLALVSIPPGLLPWLGSVNPKAPISSPRAEN